MLLELQNLIQRIEPWMVIIKQWNRFSIWNIKLITLFFCISYIYINFFSLFKHSKEVIVYTSNDSSPPSTGCSHEEILFLPSAYPSALRFPSFFYFSVSAHKCIPFQKRLIEVHVTYPKNRLLVTSTIREKKATNLYKREKDF